LGQVLDNYQAAALSLATIHRQEIRLLIGYHPFYLLRQRLAGAGDLAATATRFDARFGKRWYRPWAAPILWLPHPLALIWPKGYRDR